MKNLNTISISLISMLFAVTSLQAAETPATDPGLPHLRKQGTATQLVVDGQPFVMLAGELHNSSASGVEYLKTLWPKLRELGLNTVLAPVSWELIEPREGEFDFMLVDALLEQARNHKQRLVLLWFGSWKNGVSSYAPRWVLQDTKRFPRALGSAGRNTKDILTPLSEANRKADATATRCSSPKSAAARRPQPASSGPSGGTTPWGSPRLASRASKPTIRWSPATESSASSCRRSRPRRAPAG